MPGKIEIRAKVADYKPNAMFDDYDSGAFAAYDATMLQIISPVETVGEELTLYLNQPCSPDDVWRKIGSEVRFTIDHDLFEKSSILFVAAVKDVQVI